MAAPLPPGRVVGRAGFGLSVGDVSWAANDQVAAVGAAGEERTAIELGRIAARPGGPTVLHDLAIPIPGFTANIDHALVFGHRVVLIDTKKWKPGFYWTVAGRTRRGLEAVPHADRKTMVMAREAIVRHLASRAPRAQVGTPLLLIWPSRTDPALRTWAMATPGAKALPAAKGLKHLASRRYRTSADPSVVAALTSLVASVKAARTGADNETDFDFR